MGLFRETQLVGTAGEAGRLITRPGLSRLQDSGEITIEQMLLEAHHWVFDRLERKWTAADLGTISNTDPIKAFVAYRFAESLASQGLLPREERDYFSAQALEVDNFHPRFGSIDSPRTSTEPIPRVRNLTTGSRTPGPFFTIR